MARHPDSRATPAARWKQLELPHGDRAPRFNLDQTRVTVPGVGSVKLRKGRKVPEERGRPWIVEKNAQWYTCFECERAAQPLPATNKVVGIDRGVHVLAATSEGELISNGRYAHKHRRVVTGHARVLDKATAKDAKGRPTNWRDPKRIAAVQRLAREKEREANARLDALHKDSRRIVDSADVIGLEELNLRGMTRAVDVDARYSSKECSPCGHVAAESRRRRRFCVGCGFKMHADVNGALVIRGRAQWALTMSHIRPRTPVAAHDVRRRHTLRTRVGWMGADCSGCLR
jgi:putative transposase